MVNYVFSVEPSSRQLEHVDLLVRGSQIFPWHSGRNPEGAPDMKLPLFEIATVDEEKVVWYS